MKKLFIAMGLALTIALSSFATPTSPSGVNEAILNHFSEKFLAAQNVQWKETTNYVEAKFTWQNQQMEVFYSIEGDLMAISRNISYENLPLNVLLSIQKEYPGYSASETIEMNSTEAGLSYYVSISNAHKKIILKSNPQGELSVFKKENI